MKPILYFWWHERPEGKEKTLSILREMLKKFGFFPVFGRTSEGCYIFTVVDFIENPVENIEEIKRKWGNKYYLRLWGGDEEEIRKKVEEWKDEYRKRGERGDRGYPRILFVVSSVSKVDCSSAEIFSKKGSRDHLKVVELKL